MSDYTALLITESQKLLHLSSDFPLKFDDHVMTCRDRVKILGVWFDRVPSLEFI